MGRTALTAALVAALLAAGAPLPAQADTARQGSFAPAHAAPDDGAPGYRPSAPPGWIAPAPRAWTGAPVWGSPGAGCRGALARPLLDRRDPRRVQRTVRPRAHVPRMHSGDPPRR